ncbi:MAG: Na/Pi cotransporter family protein [Thermoguttaceae bacterium]
MSHSLRLFVATFIVFASVVSLGYSEQTTAEVLLPDPPSHAVSDSHAAAAPVESEVELRHLFTRRIPDQKVLFSPSDGVPPPTQINLAGVFDDYEPLKLDGQKPLIELVSAGKKDVVTPILVGDILTLQWKAVGKSTLTLRVTNPTTGRMATEQIKLESWSPDLWAMFLTVFGGLGVFLLGMKNLSDGLQAVAGNGLRRLITAVTDNRFSAIAVGLFFTMLIQSSSVTTVMVVGLINSQLMALTQGIGVIMGANIGTTVTAWIFTLAIDKYGLPIAGVAVFFVLFVRNERMRYVAMSVMGLGLLFFGLQLMQQGFAFLRDLPSFTAWMETFRADSYLGVLRCAAVGCILTLVVQSSSATLAITISLASMNVIPFDTAAALVLGENIGTTITAVLASIGASANARRAAAFHVLFNVIGVVWVTAIFTLALPYVITITEYVPVVFGQKPEFDVRTGIAMSHTLFNVANTVVFLPFVGVFARLLTRYIASDPPSDVAGQRRLTLSLNAPLLETPAIASERSRAELLRMLREGLAMADGVRNVYTADFPKPQVVDELFEKEQWMDTLQDEVIAFTSNLLSGNISHDVSEQVQNQMRIADELESIGDYLIVILKSNLKLRESGLAVPEHQLGAMLELHDAARHLLDRILTMYASRRTRYETLALLRSEAKSVTAKVKTIRNQFMERMSSERFDPQVIVALNAQLNAYRRVREHAENAGEAMVGMR